MSKYTYPEDRLPTPANSRVLKLIGESKEVLEVGCALGYHTRAMRDMKCRVVGIEIDPVAAEQTRPFCEHLVIGDIEQIDLAAALGDRQFDVVTFADVLEHLRDPVNALRAVQPFIKRSGYVVASIPNIAHYSVIFELANGRFEYRDRGLLDDTHIRFFTRNTMRQTFEQAGYVVASIERNRVSPAQTEFNTPDSESDRPFRSYVMKHNPEADTYQFVVKAVPAVEPVECHAALQLVCEQVRELEAELDAARREASSLRSKLSWLEGRPVHKMAAALRRVIPGRSS
ncbi:MAG: class I SAM-dependent methyltransferase [Actinobacteria bacterium]|nr:class I SAM-dependent methyltransferase [Actinomycetota bacterium]